MDFKEMITHPLGLAGFALALVFGVLSTRLRRTAPPWWPTVAILLAAVALIGGLLLAYIEPSVSTTPVEHQTASSERPVKATEAKPSIVPSERRVKGTPSVETKGDCSPAIVDSKTGDIKIDCKNLNASEQAK